MSFEGRAGSKTPEFKQYAKVNTGMFQDIHIKLTLIYHLTGLLNVVFKVTVLMRIQCRLGYGTAFLYGYLPKF